MYSFWFWKQLGKKKKQKREQLVARENCALVIGFNRGGEGGKWFQLLLQDGSFNQVPGDLWRHCGGLGKEILMPYPINQSWREQIELNWIDARVGLWDTALKFLSPGTRNDVTDHLVNF